MRGVNLALAHDVLRRMHRYIDPPGGCDLFLPHPIAGEKGVVPVGIVIEHRFAFCYWLRHKVNGLYDSRSRRRISDREFVPPDLVTIDWHDDIGGECDIIPAELRRLDQTNQAEVGLFAWAGLRGINDGHIFPAMWLNAIGDVYAIIKQRGSTSSPSYSVTDRYGKKHHVHYCRRPERFLRIRRDSPSAGLIWDIDLDYFTRKSGNPDRRNKPLLPDTTIARLLDRSQEWVQEILWNLQAITIALEPEYTGGLTTSLHLLGQWEKAFLTGPMFSEHAQWRKFR